MRRESSKLQVIDSHTGGEPTRVIVAGFPPLLGSMETRLHTMQREADWMRTVLTREPRGATWMVGAALLESETSAHTAGVVFFNNVGYLGMCGHGLIGVVATLAYQQRISPGLHRFETVAGVVDATLHDDGCVSIQNVRSHRAATGVKVEVPELGSVVGDIAYGGNWFFLVERPELQRCTVDALLMETRQILDAVQQQKIGMDVGASIDHVELFAQSSNPTRSNAVNFVLCPGGQYDRSPCGTGTSAKVACLAAEGALPPGEIWKQESIIGSVFEASYRVVDGGIIPTITGRAHITGETTIVIDPDDPFAHGIMLDRCP